MASPHLNTVHLLHNRNTDNKDMKHNVATIPMRKRRRMALKTNINSRGPLANSKIAACSEVLLLGVSSAVSVAK
jgi:hypothetical protein